MAGVGKASSITDFMRSVLENYNKMRGKKTNEHKMPFWDAIVISSSDTNQEKGYKIQISEKQQRGELPLGIPFHVFSDPSGYKIGCGGSTMCVLDTIDELYGATMLNMRFLFIPAGGYSQRLPNLSVLGKLFSPLPIGESVYQMLDLILAVYLPFLKHMPPGVFVSSSDAIISYSLLDSDAWTFENEGFTALAHPSMVHVGTTHGVYVLPRCEEPKTEAAFMSACLQVLQKPTVEEMKEAGAIIKNDSVFGSGDEGDFIYSDSTFFFDHSISTVLINFYRTNKPLKCELNSYRDFLTPLEKHSTQMCDIDHPDTQTKLHRLLQNKKLSVLVLNWSNFHHLGTMTEYILSLCTQNSFFKAFNLSKFSLSALTDINMNPNDIKGTVILSIIHPSSIVDSNSILEFCDINAVVNVNSNCIVSNIQFSDHSYSFSVPANTLLHTVLLKEGFVTIAFNIDEDIKKMYSFKDSLEVQYFHRKLGDIFMSDEGLLDSECNDVCLWNIKLFPLCADPTESVRKTLDMVLCIETCSPLPMAFTLNRNDTRWISMSDVLLLKDTKGMVSYQSELYKKIVSAKGNLAKNFNKKMLS